MAAPGELRASTSFPRSPRSLLPSCLSPPLFLPCSSCCLSFGWCLRWTPLHPIKHALQTPLTEELERENSARTSLLPAPPSLASKTFGESVSCHINLPSILQNYAGPLGHLRGCVGTEEFLKVFAPRPSWTTHGRSMGKRGLNGTGSGPTERPLDGPTFRNTPPGSVFLC